VSAIDDRLAGLRRDFTRVQPAELADRVAAGALLVDTRPVEQRERDGDLPGALVVDRNVLEWRLDPTSPHRVPEAEGGPDVVVVCDEGFSSTLVVASLATVGVRATDLAEGFQGLLAGGHLAAVEQVTTRAGRRVR